MFSGLQSGLEAVQADFPGRVFKFEITHWNLDVQACIENDWRRVQSGDRATDSLITIKNTPYESPTDYLIKKFNITLFQKKVYRAPVWRKFFEKAGLYETTLKSISWSGGGTYGSYTGSMHGVSPEDPDDFDEFDDMVEKLFGEISYIKYKRLKNLVEMETREESDYYGGRTTKCWWEVSLEKLYERAVEIGLIKAGEY